MLESLINKYIYIINYPVDEMSLAKLELRCLFGEEDRDKCIISDNMISPSVSPFIKERIIVQYEEDSFENLLDKISEKGIMCEDFKVNFLKNHLCSIEHDDRLRMIKGIGMVIKGEADIYNPKVEFGVGFIYDKWVFGEYIKHNNEWNIHNKKPSTYSNSLGYRVARNLVNIATCGDYSLSLIDPCCGVGTVLLEAESLGVTACGYEIKQMVGEKAKTNLKFFGYKDVVTIQDMHMINNIYDTCIIDLPYGLFGKITKDEQENIIITARKISKKMVIVTYEEMDDMIIRSGF
ncbi:MAG: SAM-dependent methyltransferase, partial [Clostridium sp.]